MCPHIIFNMKLVSYRVVLLARPEIVSPNPVSIAQASGLILSQGSICHMVPSGRAVQKLMCSVGLCNPPTSESNGGCSSCLRPYGTVASDWAGAVWGRHVQVHDASSVASVCPFQQSTGGRCRGQSSWRREEHLRRIQPTQNNDAYGKQQISVLGSNEESHKFL